jgi:hypothetical protein
VGVEMPDTLVSTRLLEVMSSRHAGNVKDLGSRQIQISRVIYTRMMAVSTGERRGLLFGIFPSMRTPIRVPMVRR